MEEDTMKYHFNGIKKITSSFYLSFHEPYAL